MREYVLAAVPKEILLKYRPSQGDWVYQEEDNGKIRRFFHLIKHDGNRWKGKSFLKVRNGAGFLREGPIEWIEQGNRLREARILARSTSGGVLKINLQSIAIYENFWFYESGRVEDLHFDPKEWVWKKHGLMEETNFFDYKTKR